MTARPFLEDVLGSFCFQFAEAVRFALINEGLWGSLDWRIVGPEAGELPGV
jgi:hypothetical protein